jgi:hypothetical protein
MHTEIYGGMSMKASDSCVHYAPTATRKRREHIISAGAPFAANLNPLPAVTARVSRDRLWPALSAEARRAKSEFRLTGLTAE